MSSASNLDIKNYIEENVAPKISNMEQVLGKGLNQPFSNTNSGSRKIMSGTHREHAMGLMKSEIPMVMTGYENEFGHNSSSFIKATSNYKVLHKVSKFSNYPNHHYWLILLNLDTNELDIIERISYRHITEAYGFQFNNSYLDRLIEDDVIPVGDVIKKSTSFDEFNNRTDGVNLNTLYINNNTTMEDGIQLSETAANKLKAPLFKKVTIICNDNDILLNIYGNNNEYKSFPDIGEDIKNRILCSIRREKKEESLFSQSYDRLKDIMMSDDKFTTDGTIIDINVFCNKPDNLDNIYNTQVLKYYNETMRYFTEIVDEVNKYKADHKLSYELQKFYYNCNLIVQGGQYIKDKPFSSVILELIVMEVKGLYAGDKLANRFGGKGVAAEIVKDELMPMLPNGIRVDMIYNSATVTNRLNMGQLFETSVNHISARLLESIRYDESMSLDDKLNMVYKFVYLLNKEQADFMKYSWTKKSDYFKEELLDSMYQNECIGISVRPISDTIDIDDLNNIYKEFPWIEQCELLVPITDSNNNTRYVKAYRKAIVGKQYVYRLKQYSEEKFSVTSLSSTNIRNENSRSKANKAYKGLFTKTPIRFGEMETGDMSHLGMEVVIINLMLHSTSPHARRLVEQLLKTDPFNINIKLDEYSKNRSVEILNAYFKTMGLELSFEKVYKEKITPFYKIPFIEKPKSHQIGNVWSDDLKTPFKVYAEGELPSKEVLRAEFNNMMDLYDELSRAPFKHIPFRHLPYKGDNDNEK